MDTKQRLRPRRDFGVIQEYERLDQLADIRVTDEASDGLVPAPAGFERNLAIASAFRCFG